MNLKKTFKHKGPWNFKDTPEYGNSNQKSSFEEKSISHHHLRLV